MTNYWHDLEPGEPNEINVIIELAAGSKNKYEIDKATGLIALDRTTHTTQAFPFDYGFIPRTLWDDNDPVDVILLTTFPLLPGVLVRARPIAVMRMTDDGEPDDKVIAVPLGDPRWEKIVDLKHINAHTLKEMEHFYSTYKKLQNKEVRVTGFEGRAAADQMFERGKKLYADKYLPKK